MQSLDGVTAGVSKKAATHDTGHDCATEEIKNNPFAVAVEKYITANDITETLTGLAVQKTAQSTVLFRHIQAVNPDLNLMMELGDEYRKLLFSPHLHSRDWQDQLAMLKKYDADVCGIPFAKFDRVTVVDLANVDLANVDLANSVPLELFQWSTRPIEKLIVLHGTCKKRYPHLTVANSVTVIGCHARISVAGKSFKLGIPEAVIEADKRDWDSVNNWEISELENDMNTRSDGEHNRGYLPLIYASKQSNVIGLTLQCNSIAQGIVGSKGDISVCNNKILNTRLKGIYLHDCDTATITGNTLTTKRLDEPIDIVTANCKITIQNKNTVISA